MIKQAAAYATSAAIGSVAGTLVGAVLGAALVVLAYENKKTSVTNITTPWPKVEADDQSGLA